MTMSELAKALFEAHVAHELREAQQDAFAPRITRLTGQAFAWLEQVSLQDVLARDQVLGVIDRYVIGLRISGGIAELAGQISRTIFTSQAGWDTRVDQLLSYESYREYADKVESLDLAFREVIRLLTETRGFRSFLARSLASLTQLLLTRVVGASEQGERGLLHQLRSTLGDQLQTRIELGAQQYVERHAADIARLGAQHVPRILDMEGVRSIADELWDSVGPMKLAELFAFLSVVDVEDFWVISYETWLKFRKTEFFRRTTEQVVDAIYAQYGNESLQTFLEDMGVSESMIASELRTLLGPVLAHAERTGLREQQIRARLEPFYRSEAALSLLAAKP